MLKSKLRHCCERCVCTSETKPTMEQVTKDMRGRRRRIETQGRREESEGKGIARECKHALPSVRTGSKPFRPQTHCHWNLILKTYDNSVVQ
jgi:hypothetical protein